MTKHTFQTSAGPVTVPASEPVPGLHVFEIPADVSPGSTYRWIAAHHDGAALASFTTEAAATDAAQAVGPLADWTRNAMTAGNEISLGCNADHLLDLLKRHGGHHPNA
ncbi:MULTISPECIES: hypothetical protein [Streptomyces albidoflavus group]|uniref:Uncharacterized protein n=1 Tax=Streptomyces albidoflavus TaxID=1886 RepID=A0ABY3GU18_9ACTN|nr:MULTISPECIES: hypothetical protein [Streptomyces albidoflavus group]TWV19418.1 hypothetical protein FRZ02_24385 [Streptomyces albidoflavus]